MSDRLRINRVAGFGRVGMAPTLLGAHDILTITDAGGVPLVTTAAPHGISSQLVTITGTGIYNGAGQQADGATATTFTLTDGTYTADASGGRWD